MYASLSGATVLIPVRNATVQADPGSMCPRCSARQGMAGLPPGRSGLDDANSLSAEAPQGNARMCAGVPRRQDHPASTRRRGDLVCGSVGLQRPAVDAELPVHAGAGEQRPAGAGGDLGAVDPQFVAPLGRVAGQGESEGDGDLGAGRRQWCIVDQRRLPVHRTGARRRTEQVDPGAQPVPYRRWPVTELHVGAVPASVLGDPVKSSYRRRSFTTVIPCGAGESGLGLVVHARSLPG